MPSTVCTVEYRRELPEGGLFPDERRIAAQAVSDRRREFATGRCCAHLALEKLGLAPTPILKGPQGEPRWPVGVVGSITHCGGYRAAAVARSADILSIGIDAEPLVALPEGVAELISGPSERRHLAALGRVEGQVPWDLMLFAAKEACYKAWYPLAHQWLGFKDVEVTFDPRWGLFDVAVVARDALSNDCQIDRFRGRFMAGEGLAIVAVVVPIRS